MPVPDTEDTGSGWHARGIVPAILTYSPPTAAPFISVVFALPLRCVSASKILPNELEWSGVE